MLYLYAPFLKNKLFLHGIYWLFCKISFQTLLLTDFRFRFLCLHHNFIQSSFYGMGRCTAVVRAPAALSQTPVKIPTSISGISQWTVTPATWTLCSLWPLQELAHTHICARVCTHTLNRTKSFVLVPSIQKKNYSYPLIMNILLWWNFNILT